MGDLLDNLEYNGQPGFSAFEPGTLLKYADPFKMIISMGLEESIEFAYNPLTMPSGNGQIKPAPEKILKLFH
ncbi:MAG: hypothetical protein HKP58_03120 [Desulfatitalea sp.]|nr:hypothetical protein [Desulfatitalea sp.]NNJ99383.1 hypothetical protein [Desulfatitalea sp.]